MQAVAIKKGWTAPEQVKIVYEVKIVGGAVSFEPCIKTKDPAVPHVATVERGDGARNKNGQLAADQ